jgi:hypothetical protein
MAFIQFHSCPSDLGLQRNEFPPNPAWQTWARVRSNYVVNGGNTTYGQHGLNKPCPGATDPATCDFKGAPFIPKQPNKLGNISDGTANTLMMSEIRVLPETPGWGGPYSDAQTALGGQVFTGWQPPNSPLPDCLCRVGEWLTPDVVQGFETQQMARPLAATPGSPCGVAMWSVQYGARGFPATDPAMIDSNGHKQQWITARSHHVGGVNASRCDASVKFYADSIDPFTWNALSSAAADDLPGAE